MVMNLTILQEGKEAKNVIYDSSAQAIIISTQEGNFAILPDTNRNITFNYENGEVNVVIIQTKEEWESYYICDEQVILVKQDQVLVLASKVEPVNLKDVSLEAAVEAYELAQREFICVKRQSLEKSFDSNESSKKNVVDSLDKANFEKTLNKLLHMYLRAKASLRIAVFFNEADALLEEEGQEEGQEDE